MGIPGGGGGGGGGIPPSESAKSIQHPHSNIWLSNGAYPGPTLSEMLGAPMVVGKGRSRGNSKGSGRYWEG